MIWLYTLCLHFFDVYWRMYYRQAEIGSFYHRYNDLIYLYTFFRV